MFPIIFYLNGIFYNSSCKTFFFSIVFHLWLLIALILNIIHISREYNRLYFTIWISYIAAVLTSLATYVTLWLKKYQILSLKKTIINFHSTTFRTSTLLKVFQFLNLFLFIVYPAVFIYFNLKVGHIHMNLSDILCMGTTAYAFIFYQLTLPLSVALLYANFCYLCSSALNVIESRIKCPSVTKTKQIISNLHYYETILNFATSVENAFSTVTFFSMVSYVIIAFTSMGNLVKGNFSGNYVVIFQVSFVFVFATFCMTILIVYASETPITIERIKVNLIVLEGKLSLTCDTRDSKLIKKFIKTFTKRNVFAFSACNMVHFKRSLIITSYGTLISYGLLLLQLQ